jgi:hypothetical protein
MVCITLALLVAAFGNATAKTESGSIFVSTVGNDKWSGSLAAPNAAKSDGPFATLEAARDAVRDLKARGKMPTGGVTVWLREGTYRLSQSFSLTAEDTGTPEAPIVYAAYRDEEVRLTGGQSVTGFKPVTDERILSRLKPEARSKVMQADLRAIGIDTYGSLAARGFGRPIVPSHAELFVDDQPMRLARFPNAGWLKTAGAPDGPKGATFTYNSAEPGRWKDPADVWVHGYWTWDWADSYEKVKSIDAGKMAVTTEPPHGVYGYAKDKRFVFLNVLEELDEPGEWYLDRVAGMLYFWPTMPLADSKVELSTLGNPLVTLRNASNIRLRNLIFECGRASGVDMAGGTDDLVQGCSFRNLGMYAAGVDGFACGLQSCNIYNTADGGVVLNGGDRATLKPGKNFVVNCDIHDYQTWDRTYRPGVHIFGVGNRIANNRIHDAPHCGILLHGNDHLIEYNEIFRVCEETSDAGAFYLGRDFTERGNVVQFNYFHELDARPDVNAIYLDDWASGTSVYGNVLVNAGRGLLIGGGRDNSVENNLFVNCKPAIHVDARGLGWAKTYFDPNGDRTLWNRLDAVKFDQPPYSTKYKGLADVKKDDPAVPKRNRIANNISVGGPLLNLIDDLKPEQIPVLKNWDGGDPGFASLEKRDFRILPNTPGAKLKFRALPLDKIGLQKDEFRRTVPKVWGSP